jgi:hypothetical protein
MTYKPCKGGGATVTAYQHNFTGNLQNALLIKLSKGERTQKLIAGSYIIQLLYINCKNYLELNGKRRLFTSLYILQKAITLMQVPYFPNVYQHKFQGLTL